MCGTAVRRKSVYVRFLPVREARSQSVFCPLEGRGGLGGAVWVAVVAHGHAEVFLEDRFRMVDVSESAFLD